MSKAKILLIEDDESYVNSVRLMLHKHPTEVTWASTGSEGIQAYRKNTLGYATVIVDYKLPDLTGRDVARHIKKLNPGQDILFASGYRDSNYLTDMLESGLARTFIPKACPIEEARAKILDSINIFENEKRVIGRDEELSEKPEQNLGQFGIIGKSRGIQKVIELIRKYRDLPYWVRITGETGVGKELVANALTPPGKRKVEINCAEFATSENAMESELFGHVKGSFTGADQDKPGLLLQAHKQILFLDEVHTLSNVAQTKLLRVLQEKKFRRKGDPENHLIPIDFRLISAMKPEIYDRIKDERFSEDLFRRLGKLDIRIPALRERPEDVEPLVRHYQDQFNRSLPSVQHKQFRISTILQMKKHPWTGNVRELDAAVTSMLVNAKDDIVHPSDFESYLKGENAAGTVTSKSQSMTEMTEKLQIEKITAALISSPTQVQAAAKLGIDRWLLLRRMKRLGINPKSYLQKL